jgi:GTPase SAR1 family protein
LPNTENEPDHILIVGQTGAGKSSVIADYLREIIQMGQKTIFIFTASTKPEPYDKLNPYNKVVKIFKVRSWKRAGSSISMFFRHLILIWQQKSW